MGTPVDRSETFTGPGSRSIQLSGRYIRVLAADSSGVTITPHPGSPLLRYVGQDVDAGAQFTWFDITVTVACTVKLCVSDQRQADNSAQVNATVSATVGAGGTIGQPGDVACANGVSTQLIAGNANRLALIVKGPASGAWGLGTVRVGTTGVGAASGLELNPGESITIGDTAPVAAYNGSGASVTLQILEVAK